MRTEDLEINVGGTALRGQVMYDEVRAGKRPGVLVVHEGFGLGPHALQRAERLAGEFGYVAYAMDLFGEAIRDAEHAMQWIHKLLGDPAMLRSRVGTALEALSRHSRVDSARLGAIGYCFGGTAALELARSGASVNAVVVFHAGLQTTNPADAKNIKGKILVCNGALDPFADRTARGSFEEEMSSAGVDWQLNLYGRAKHSYTTPGSESWGPAYGYDRATDERSWAAMAAMFAEAFQ